jgi:serine/threonine protein kinase
MATGAPKPPNTINVITGEGSEDVLEYGPYKIYRDFNLGSGSFGDVYKGYDTKKRRLIAAKQIRLASAECSQTEVDVLMKLTEHDNIVRIFDTFMHTNSRYIIMQFCNGLCLDKYLQQKNPLLDTRTDMIFQIIETVQFMHFANPRTAHRDLKPSNVMVVHGGQIKLCDFGIAKFMDTEKSFNISTKDGTPKYMSPEIYQCSKYDPFKADVFAAGLVLLVIITFVVGENIDHVFPSGKLYPRHFIVTLCIDTAFHLLNPIRGAYNGTVTCHQAPFV